MFPHHLLEDAAGLILDTGQGIRSARARSACLPGKKDILFLHEAVLVTELFYTWTEARYIST